MGTFPLGIGSALCDLLVPRHLLSRSLHGQEESGAPQPIPIEDSAPHLPKGPESAAESRSSRILLQKKTPGMSLSGPASHTQVSQTPTLGPGEAQPGLPLGAALSLGCDCPARV